MEREIFLVTRRRLLYLQHCGLRKALVQRNVECTLPPPRGGQSRRFIEALSRWPVESRWTRIGAEKKKKKKKRWVTPAKNPSKARLREQKDEEIPTGQVKTRDKRWSPRWAPCGLLSQRWTGLRICVKPRESPLLKAFVDKSSLLRTRGIIEISKLEFGLPL